MTNSTRQPPLVQFSGTKVLGGGWLGSRVTRNWLITTAQQHGALIQELGVIFCADDYIQALNRAYLQHDYPTDVLTFDYREPHEKAIDAELYIGVEQVAAQASLYQVEPIQELYRVLVHGLLHLLGYDDQCSAEAARMRAEEDRCLAQLQAIKNRTKRAKDFIPNVSLCAASQMHTMK